MHVYVCIYINVFIYIYIYIYIYVYVYIYIYILKGEVSKSNQTTECRMLIFIEKCSSIYSRVTVLIQRCG